MAGLRSLHCRSTASACSSSSSRPARIPAIVGSSWISGFTIVQFGEAAVAPLVSAARQGHFSEQSSVLYALQLLVEGRSDIVIAGNILPARIAPAQLSTESKRQIRDLARDLLKPKAVKHSNILYSVANLALATGDLDLRQQVQALVDLPSQLSDTTGIKDANQLLQAHNLIRDALAEHKQ